jgi:hypothetical protein
VRATLYRTFIELLPDGGARIRPNLAADRGEQNLVPFHSGASLSDELASPMQRSEVDRKRFDKPSFANGPERDQLTPKFDYAALNQFKGYVSMSKRWNGVRDEVFILLLRDPPASASDSEGRDSDGRTISHLKIDAEALRPPGTDPSLLFPPPAMNVSIEHKALCVGGEHLGIV